MKVVPWAAILSTVIALALIVVVALGKLPWPVVATFLAGSVLPVLQSKVGAS